MRSSHYKAALHTGALRDGHGRNVQMLVKLVSDVYVRILSVELMITQGMGSLLPKGNKAPWERITTARTV